MVQVPPFFTPGFGDADGVLVRQGSKTPSSFAFARISRSMIFKRSLAGITGDEIAGVDEFAVAVIHGNNLVGRSAQQTQDKHRECIGLAFTA